MKINKNISIVFVCIILGITLAWQYQSIRSDSKIADIENSRKEDLVNKLIAERENNDNLRKKNEELKDEIKKYQNASGNNDANTKILMDEINRLKIIAGFAEVKGKGVTITFSEDDVQSMVEKDLWDILNELKATDAQAIAFNDERIVATSEVREIESIPVLKVSVNGRQLVPPFVIKAIVNPEDVEYAFKMLGGIAERINLESAGGVTAKVKKSDNIVIPKVRDEVIKTDLMTPVEK